LPSKSQISYQILFNKTSNYHDFRVLGCLCFPLTRPYNKHKLELRAQPCVFIGYAISHKGYHCLQLSSNIIFISRNIQFNEHSYPFKEIPTISKTTQFEDIILPPLQLLQPTIPLSVPHPAVNRPTTLSISDLGPAASPSTFPSAQAPSLSTHDALHIDPLLIPDQAHFHEHDNPICSSAHHHDNSSAQDASSLAPDPPSTQLLAPITSSSNPNGPVCLNIPSSSPLATVTESLHSSPAL
jgi:hypothetical protein